MTTLRLGSDDNPQLTHLVKTLLRDDQSPARRIASVVLIMAALVVVTACGHAMMMHRAYEVKGVNGPELPSPTP